MAPFNSPVWISGFISSVFNLLASSIFFSYILYRIFMDTCGVRKRIQNLRGKYQKMDLEEHRRSVTFEQLKRGKPFLNRSIRYLIIFQFVSMGMTFDKVIGLFTDPPKHRFWCVLQALFLHIFGIEMHLWSMIIAFYLFYTTIILGKKYKDYPKLSWTLEIVSHIFVHTLTAIFVSMPYIAHVVGPSGGGWCWVDHARYPKLGNIMIYASFYGPVWVIMIITAIVYGSVLVHLFKSIYRSNRIFKYLKDEHHLALTIKLLLYPGISLVVWIIPTINRGFNAAGIGWTPLVAAHFFCIPLNGTLNVIAYFLNPLKHIKLLYMIFCCPLYMVNRKRDKYQSYVIFKSPDGTRKERSRSILDAVQFLADSEDEETEDSRKSASNDKEVALLDAHDQEEISVPSPESEQQESVEQS